MKSHRIAAVLVLATFGGVLPGCEKSSRNKNDLLPVIPRLNVRGWPAAGSPALRCADDACETVLITIPSMEEKRNIYDGVEFEPSNVLMQFFVSNRTLTSANAQVWKSATGEIMTRGRQSILSNIGGVERAIGSIRFRQENFNATCSAQPVRAQGSAILSVDGSPDGRLASVLSAEGSPSGGLPFAKNDRAKGDHFMEIWDVHECRRIGPPYRIEKPEGVGAPSVCWAPDSKTVVIIDAFMNRYLWFVPVPLTNEKEE